jgi:hypothetical protein
VNERIEMHDEQQQLAMDAEGEDPVAVVTGAMTEEERERFLRVAYRMNPHLQGGPVWDLLEMLVDQESYCGLVEAILERIPYFARLVDQGAERMAVAAATAAVVIQDAGARDTDPLGAIPLALVEQTRRLIGAAGARDARRKMEAAKAGRPEPPSPELTYWLVDCFVCGKVAVSRSVNPPPGVIALGEADGSGARRVPCTECGTLAVPVIVRQRPAMEVGKFGSIFAPEPVWSEGDPVGAVASAALESARGAADTERRLAEKDADEFGTGFLVGGIRADPTTVVVVTPGGLSDPDARRLGPFARESDTSRRAALEAYPRQGTQRWRILGVLAAQHSSLAPGAPIGYTRDELAAKCGMSPNTVRPRVRELIEGGWVEESETFTRKTTSGRDAALVLLSDRGRDRLVKPNAWMERA